MTKRIFIMLVVLLLAMGTGVAVAAVPQRTLTRGLGTSFDDETPPVACCEPPVWDTQSYPEPYPEPARPVRPVRPARPLPGSAVPLGTPAVSAYSVPDGYPQP